ncbi:MAG: hypothetical protein WCJ19_01185 [bacterium]
MPTNNQAASTQDIQALKKQIDDLQSKLERANKVTTALIAGDREENLLFKWKAPTRLYLKRDKQWYLTILLIFLISAVFLLYIKEYVLILVILSILFVLYVSSVVPPEETEHQITTLGIRTLGELYTWDMMKDYWISFKNGREVLNIDTNITSPTRLLFLFSSEDKPKIIEVLKQKLAYMEAPRKQGKVTQISEGIYIPLSDVEATMVKRIVS